MRILFYDWALHTIGGGQKFNCKIAEHLSKKHQVEIITLFPVDRQKLEKIYSVDLSKIKIINLYKKEKNNDTLLKINASKDISRLSKNYDIFFNADAQETVYPKAKKNIMYCHFFEPIWYRPSKGFFDFFKLLGLASLRILKGNYSKNYDVYCNSKYTQYWLEKLWHVNSKIIYPPVDIPSRIGRKENLIISTGRIAPDKNYEIVIDIFKKANLENYKLLICGKADNPSYLEKLKKISSNSKVEFKTDLGDKELKKIYSSSKIFIQAKGLEINEKKYPALLEHFGMTTAEAMAHGAIPLVLNKGGYKEIVDKSTGFLFDNVSQAVVILKKLASNQKLINKMSQSAIKRAKIFSLQRMQKQIDKII